jgi:hypothetical protein
MVAGRRIWIFIWYGMLVLGLLGLVASVYWARRTHWRNLDEFLRAIGTVLVSLGMIVLLRGSGDVIGTSLMIGAVGAFIAAFVVGRQWGEAAERGPDAGDEPRG